MKLMPQEIEVRYIIPSIRREFARGLVKKNYKQKDIAKILEITPAAISQYLKEKRGTINFDPSILKEIEKSLKYILEDNKKLQIELFRLTNIIKNSGLICQIHREYDEVPAHCDLCFYNENK